MKRILQKLYLVSVLFISAFALNTSFVIGADAAAKLSSKTIAGWQGPKSGKEGTYICIEGKCGDFAVVGYEERRLSRSSKKAFEKAKKDRKRFDRFFKLAFKFGNIFSRAKVSLVGKTSSLKIGKFTGIGQAIRLKEDANTGHGYIILLPVDKRVHTFSAIAATPSKAKSLAIKFAKGLQF